MVDLADIKCKYCKHWKQGSIHSHPPGIKKHYGDCLSPLTVKTFEKDFEISSVGLSFFMGEDSTNGVAFGEDFGCIHFEEDIRKTGD